MSEIQVNIDYQKYENQALIDALEKYSSLSESNQLAILNEVLERKLLSAEELTHKVEDLDVFKEKEEKTINKPSSEKISKLALEMVMHSNSEEVEVFFEQNNIKLVPFVQERISYLNNILKIISIAAVAIFLLISFSVVYSSGIYGTFQIIFMCFLIFLLFKKRQKIKHEKHTLEFYI